MEQQRTAIFIALLGIFIFIGGFYRFISASSLPGDVNGDDTVSIIDALLVAKYTTGENPAPFFPQAADVDRNGVIDINDALLISRFTVGMITQFPYNGAFPRIDENTNWIIGEQHFDNSLKMVQIHDVAKKVEIGTEVFENRKCFRSMEVAGVVIDGWQYSFGNSIYQRMLEDSDLITIEGLYSLSGITDSVSLRFQFFKDGKFWISCSLLSDQDHEAIIPVKIDYDFNTGIDNVFEFVWNKNSVYSENLVNKDPPDGIADLHYKLPSGWCVDYWSAVENEVRLSFPKLSTVSNEKSNENTALCRVKDVSQPGKEFGAVFWAGNSEYELIFKQKSESIEIAPQVNASTKIQSCTIPVGTNVYYPKYVTAGTDQMMYIILKGVKSGESGNGIGGKLFQRGGGRRLHVKVHTFPDMQLYGESKSFWFNPDLIISVENNENRTFRKALIDLVGDPKLLSISVIQESTYPPFYMYPLSSNDNFNYSPHELLYYNRDMSSTVREKADEMTVDAYVVNYSYNGTFASMFDCSNGGDNHIEKEGVIVYWGDFLKAAGEDGRQLIPDWNARAINEALLHEIGHTLNFDHDTDNTNRTIMSKGPFNPDNQSIRYLDRQKNWFTTSPDTWVKPGRYGVNFGGLYY